MAVEGVRFSSRRLELVQSYKHAAHKRLFWRVFTLFVMVWQGKEGGGR